MYTSANIKQGYEYHETSEDAKRLMPPVAQSEQVGRGKAGEMHLKSARRYAIAAVGCIAFAIIYAQFSHGVSSLFMTCMFAIPLIGGVIPALLGGVAKTQPLPRMTRQSWALAIASLTIASCLKGIFDIAGTSSPLLVVYVLAAIAFLIVAATGLFRK